VRLFQIPVLGREKSQKQQQKTIETAPAKFKKLLIVCLFSKVFISEFDFKNSSFMH
jgi:hypothetical protein